MTNLPESALINEKHSLRRIDDVPEPYRSIFADYPHFNVIQSAIFNDVFYSDVPIVVSAPTGSGKTTIFELAIVRLLLNWETCSTRDFKIIYISPTKALCEERLVDWHKKFAPFNLSCICVTGDSLDVDISSLINSKLIITTPEKWDSLTRRWRDNERIVQVIKLFMIDEIHLLNDETRGSTLEAIVTRMKTIHSSYQIGITRTNSGDGIRLVGVSATIANAVDIAEWFDTPGNSAKYFKFEDGMRPVKLQKIVQGYPYNPSLSSPFKFDIMLSYKLHNVILQHSSGKPSLIFCSTRKSVEMTCKQLVQNLTINLTMERKQILAQAANSLEDSKLRESLIHGVACHHAGMLHDDRRKIENLFREGNLPILVTTSTLAMGVNLPAHLVVIKSTKYYMNGEYRDYGECMIFQMIGRAGRPQFDTSAVAVIMTTAADKHKYENLVSGEQPIESHLHKTLAEHVNAEVVLRTITDLSIAMQWLSSTFFYIRARKNPRHYSLPIGLSQTQMDKKLLEVCQIEINKLAKAGMLTIDQNVAILPTHTGSLMAKYCAALETMKLFTEVTGNEILQQILGLISKCREFSEIRLRTNDKRPLNILNQNRNKKTIRFPLTGKIKTLDMKINCIVQAVLGNLEISETSLLVEAQRIMRVGERLLNCLSEYLQNKEHCYKALLSSKSLAKCFHARIWENSSYVSRQLEGIGLCLSNLLVGAGKTSFKEILDSNPRDLERILNKKPPFGNRIQEQVKTLPQYDLLVKEVILDDGKVTIELTIVLENRSVFEKDISVHPNGVMTLLVGDSENNILLHERYTHMYMIENVQVGKSIDIKTSFEHEVFVNFVSEDWVGFDVNKSIKLFATEVEQPENNATSSSGQKVLELPDSTNGNIRAKRHEKVKKSSMLQQCMDQYFKKVKTPKRDNRILTKRRSSTQLKKKASNSKLTESNPSIPKNNDKISKDEKIINDEAKVEKSINTADENNETSSSDPKVSNIFNVSNNIFKQNSNFFKSMYGTVSEPKNEIDLIPPTPIKLHRSVLRTQAKSNIYKRKRERNAMVNFEFENSMYNQNEEPKLDLSQFVMDLKKQIATETPLESKRIRLEKEEEDRDNSTKSLTWRSPLVTSPKSKFSPHFQKIAPISSSIGDDNVTKKMPIENSMYNQNEEPKVDLSQFVMDLKKQIVQETPLESKRIRLEKEEEDRYNSTKSLAWRSPLVTSPKSKFSPHLPKTAPISSSIGDDNVTKKMPSLKNNISVFQLSDKDCVYNSENHDLKYTDIISQSFLEGVGLKATKLDTLEYNSQTIATTSGQDQLKCDLNQTASSVSSGSTTVVPVLQTKVIDSASYYARILKRTPDNNQTQFKCVASQTENLPSLDQNNDGNNEKLKTTKNTVQNELTSHELSENNITLAFGGYNTSITPQLVDDHKLHSKNISIQRNNSWEAEFLSEEPFFENVNTPRKEHIKELDTKGESKKECTYKSLNPFEDTRTKVLNKSIENFNPKPCQNKRIQETQPSNFLNTTLLKELPERKSLFGNSKGIANYKYRTAEQSDNFDSKSFYNKKDFRESNWMNTSSVSFANKDIMNTSFKNGKDCNDQSIFETTLNYEQAKDLPYLNNPQQYHGKPFGNVPHFSDSKEPNKFYCCENYDDFGKKYPSHTMNDHRNRTSSNDVRRNSISNPYAQIYFENTTNPGNFDFPVEQPQFLRRNYLPARGDFPEKYLENSGPSSVQSATYPNNNGNLAVKYSAASFYENTTRNPFLNNQQTLPNGSSMLYEDFQHSGRSSYKIEDTFGNVGRFTGINTNDSYYDNGPRDHHEDFNEGNYIKNYNIKNQAREYNQILPNYMQQENIRAKKNHILKPIVNNSATFFHQNPSYVSYHGSGRNFRHAQYEEQQQIRRHSEVDANNKSAFLLNRYFSRCPKENLFNFNREQLNLNHTITSDEVHNLAHNF